MAWTEGNLVVPLVDGASYMGCLATELARLGHGDQVRFTDWRSDADERLTDGGRAIGTVFSELCRHGVDVRGLVWRSHSDRLSFSAKENKQLATEINLAGGEVQLDERVRRGGSHHQKLVVLRHPGDERADVAFVGGIDLCHGRRDDREHSGDRQAVELDQRYGSHPAWHDLQLDVRGPAVGDLDFTFRERWTDETPLNHSNPIRAWLSSRMSGDRIPDPLPHALPDPPPVGRHAVQVLRTYPCSRPPYSFAPDGERSIARANAKAFRRARRLVYVEDQYLWSSEIAKLLAVALSCSPDLHVIVVVPRYPDKDGHFSGPPNRVPQHRAMSILRAAGGDRVAFYDVENDDSCPVYVHAKVCVIDDVWATVGSDNLNRRSWTHDSELACAVIDADLDDREPLDPGGLGDGARCFARNLRLSLWAEHLGRPASDPELVDPARGFALWRQTAEALEHWHRQGRTGPRPAGRVRPHPFTPDPDITRSWADVVYRLLFDPDGRPLQLRVAQRF